MSNNTRLGYAQYGHSELPRFLPRVTNPEPNVQPTNNQPKSETANTSTSLDHWSIPLPSEDDLFNQFINYPTEDKPQVVSSTVITNHPIKGPAANLNDNIQTNQETNSPDTTVVPGGADPPDAHGSFSAHTSWTNVSEPEAFLDGRYRCIATLGSFDVDVDEPHVSIQPENETRITERTVIQTIRPHELYRVSSQPLPVAPATSTHTATQTSSSMIEATASPTSSESAHVLNVSNDTVHLPYKTDYKNHSPKQALPSSQPQAHPANLETSNQPPTARQHHPLIQAYVPVPSRAATPEPQVRNNQPGLIKSTFKPTPLKQSWTSNDFALKEFTGNTTSQSAHAHASVQSRTPPQLDPIPQSGCYTPALWSNCSESSGNHCSARVLGPMQTFGSAQPQAPPQTERQPTHHPNALIHGASAQRFQPFSQLQDYPSAPVTTLTQSHLPTRSSNSLQTGFVPARALTQAPTQLGTQASQAPQTASLQRIQSYAPIQASSSAQPSGLNQQLPSARPRSVLLTPTASNLLALWSNRLPARSSLSTLTMTMTPPLSPTVAHHPAQSQATDGGDALVQAQQSAQLQQYLANFPRPGAGVGMLWLVPGDGEEEWYHLEVGVDGRPTRIYTVPAPAVIPPSCHVHHPRYLDSHPQPPAPLPSPSPASSHQHVQVQPAPQEIHEAPYQVQDYAGSAQPSNNQPRASTNNQGYMRQPPPFPVQRSHPALSFRTQAPKAPVVLTPRPLTGSLPRFGNDDFSPLYWRHFGAVPQYPHRPSLGRAPSATTHGQSTYSHAPIPGPSTQSSAPGPSTPTLARVPAHVATHSPNQSGSSLSNLSRSTSPWTPGYPVPAPQDKGKKRRIEADSEEDDSQEDQASDYQASRSSGKGKRSKLG
ncbi:hypothetical protein B0J17DRAFT_735124 [Rhizoctonia solani]|nr:hypothetical protein B0J17DRAFT_735124 [Rhizoctonia solani]